MTGNEYQELACRTINQDLDYHELMLHSLHGMAGEVGEIHSIYQKRYQGHYIVPDDVRKELGDLLWFVAEYCTSQGWWLEDIMKENIEKLKARYPDGFSSEKSVNRDE